MRTFFCLFAFVLTLSMPLHAAAPSHVAAAGENIDDQVRLIRYAYEVSWEGGSGWRKSGRVGVAVLVDLEHDQQQLQLVREDGHLMGRLVQQGTLAFMGATGENMEPMLDLMVGMHFLDTPVGLGTFADWARGHDGRGPLDQALIEYDERGQPVSLDEDGWQVRYANWTQASGLEVSVPAQWTITHERGLSMSLDLVAAEAYSSETAPKDYNPIQIR